MSRYLSLSGDGYERVRLIDGEVVSDGAGTGSDDLPLLTPGLIDLHLHGGFGIDVMEADRARLEALDDRLREDAGYDGWLPTTVTCTPEAALAVLEALPDRPSVLGLHLEGPFLSPKHPGAQPLPYLAEYPGPGSAWDRVLDHPRLRVVTLAPEIKGGLDLVRRLVARGVIVSLGHTDATWDQTQAAIDAGARHFTHAFNAMRPFHHREAGIVGRLLAGDLTNSNDPTNSSDPGGSGRTYAELIYDRLHVAREAATVLLRGRTPEGVLGVSDGTMAIGLFPGTRLEMWGHRCIVGDGDVRLVGEDGQAGGLAGSAVDLSRVFRNLASDFGRDVASRCCIENPRRVLGLPPKWGGLIAFDADLEGFHRVRAAR